MKNSIEDKDTLGTILFAISLIVIIGVFIMLIMSTIYIINNREYLSDEYAYQVVNDTIYQDYKKEINLNDYPFISIKDMENMIIAQDKNNTSDYKFNINETEVSFIDDAELTVYNDFDLNDNGYYLINGALYSKEFLMNAESIPDFIVESNDFIKFSNDSKYDELKESEYKRVVNERAGLFMIVLFSAIYIIPIAFMIGNIFTESKYPIFNDRVK